MPKQFGKFQLVEMIAEGGMGIVYKGIVRGADGFEKTVCIKQILAEHCRQKTYIGHFRREALVSARLNHPNIVQTYHFDKVGDQYYIEMEYIDGVDLARLKKTGQERKYPAPLNVTLDIVKQICHGLDYAYCLEDVGGEALKLVHRDLDPKNVILSFDGHAKIIDFGLVKAKEEISDLSGSDDFKGKVAYAAPEQFEARNIDNRTDIFALGTLFYELVVGQNPFTKKGIRAVIRMKMGGDFPHPKLAAPDLPMEVADIIMKCMAVDPDDRFQSSLDIIDAIEEIEHLVSAEISSREYVRYIFDRLRPREKERLEKKMGSKFFTRLGLKYDGAPVASSLMKVLNRFVDKAKLLSPQLGPRREEVNNVVQIFPDDPREAALRVKSMAEGFLRDLCRGVGATCPHKAPLEAIDELAAAGVLPVDAATPLLTIRMATGKLLGGSDYGTGTGLDAAGMLSALFEILEWYYCKFFKGPRLSGLYEVVEASTILEPEVGEQGTMLGSAADSEATASIGRMAIEPLLPAMVVIEAGFLALGTGDDPGMISEEKAFTHVPMPMFSIGMFPVTNEEYRYFLSSTRRAEPKSATIPNLVAPDRPVTAVTCDDALAYCKWLSELTGKTYRLPTELEWEKAARGGVVLNDADNPEPLRRFPWGNKDLKGRANIGGCCGGVTAIQEFAFGKSPYGCFDMLGNVWEWSADWYDPDAYRRYAAGDLRTPDSGVEKVLRGGSWYAPKEECRIRHRVRRKPEAWDFDIGFRLACDS
jgi:formylglycine-generating enzyme required for sulfatase activity/serine/threonine protein kinase